MNRRTFVKCLGVAAGVAILPLPVSALHRGKPAEYCGYFGLSSMFTATADTLKELRRLCEYHMRETCRVGHLRLKPGTFRVMFGNGTPFGSSRMTYGWCAYLY